MQRTRRKTDELKGGPLDGMTVAAGGGRTLLVPVRATALADADAAGATPRLVAVRLTAEYSRPRPSGPFYWTRWTPR